jgi:hypothetical protein
MLVLMLKLMIGIPLLAGLVGPLIVSAKGQALNSGRTAGVDRDIITLFQVMDDDQPPCMPRNAQVPGLKNGTTSKYTINGMLSKKMWEIKREEGTLMFVNSGTENDQRNRMLISVVVTRCVSVWACGPVRSMG